ncbi:MAG: phosphoribosylformylglycinamidine synthase subunit PurQ [Bacillota bacterium]|nr:phosphoribosylformylglycinamidine synthase subunit PurQ [Bacillota bacterium]MDI7249013.1 phosphoribosylformylglycinamidine synthase subunit PurQ [Bacillota bacterium]
MRFGVVVFPGSNCDADCHHAIGAATGARVEYVWHRDTKISGFDCLVLPGGFSYGDYLRTGAIARFSPVMGEIARFAAGGGLVLGICNGFQILQEAGLLPGAMRKNESLTFRCQWTWLRVEDNRTPFTLLCEKGQVLRIPIAHYEGNFYLPPEELAEVEGRGQVVMRYSTPAGEVVPEANPNGSLGNIAAVRNAAGNVLGMMPHPERAAEGVLGCEDGRLIFRSVVEYLRGSGR